jgi:hypothetical protein
MSAVPRAPDGEGFRAENNTFGLTGKSSSQKTSKARTTQSVYSRLAGMNTISSRAKAADNNSRRVSVDGATCVWDQTLRDPASTSVYMSHSRQHTLNSALMALGATAGAADVSGTFDGPLRDRTDVTNNASFDFQIPLSENARKRTSGGTLARWLNHDSEPCESDG